jgi:uncharacterized membrane protein
MTMDQNAINQAEWDNPDNWSAGLYFSKKDTRTLVPKSNPIMGFTFNLGTRAGAMWMIGLMVGIPLLIIAITVLSVAIQQ